MAEEESNEVKIEPEEHHPSSGPYALAQQSTVVLIVETLRDMQTTLTEIQELLGEMDERLRSLEDYRG